MTAIYIDTNIIMNEGFFRSTWSKSFLKACALLKIDVIIPDVVFDEVVGNYPKKLKERVLDFQKAEKELVKLVDLQISDFDISNLLNEYRDYLSDLIDETDVDVAPYPNVSAKELVEKSYQNDKPFKDSGEGHKDYLVWETVKSHILAKNVGEANIFVTNNVKDFCINEAGKSLLHPYLANQIEVEKARPVIHTSLRSVFDEEIMPHLEGMSLEDIPDLSQSDIESTTNAILLDELPQRTVYGFEDVPFSNDVSISTVDDAQISSIKFAKAGDQVIIKIAGKVEIEVEGFMDKFEIYHIGKESNVYVVDSNWNDHVAAVGTMVETDFDLSLFYSLTKKVVVGHEVALPQEVEDQWPYK